MRECWINVYDLFGKRHHGRPVFRRDHADDHSDGGFAWPVYRLHVRLKPKPKRYVAAPEVRRTISA